MPLWVPAGAVRIVGIDDDVAEDRAPKRDFFMLMQSGLGITGLFVFGAIFALWAGVALWAGEYGAAAITGGFALLAIVGASIGLVRRKARVADGSN